MHFACMSCPLINDYSSASKCLLVCNCDAVLEQYCKKLLKFHINLVGGCRVDLKIFLSQAMQVSQGKQ